MQFDGKEKQGKKTYQKPKLRIIELAAEEVMAVGCKTDHSGIAAGQPFPPCVPSCSGYGS